MKRRMTMKGSRRLFTATAKKMHKLNVAVSQRGGIRI